MPRSVCGNVKDEGKYYTISINSQKAGYVITSIDKLISKTQDNVIVNSFWR